MISKANNTKIPIKLEIFNNENEKNHSTKTSLIQRNHSSNSTSVKFIKSNKLQEETKTRIVKKNNVQNLSPIKPSFVSAREDNIIPINQMNFAHSTPNHHSTSSPKVLPIFHATPKKSDVESLSKKQLIVKELAVNILELNGYRTRTEQLDTELKSFNKLKKETSGREYSSISEKSECIHNELEKLKVEMLQKIEDIHKLESELIKIEGHNSSKSSSCQRNEEVMSEIRTMLKDMVENSGQNSTISSNRIYEEYSRTMRRLTCSSPTLQLKKIESDFIETGDIYRKYNQFRTQIDQECCYLMNQAKDLEFKLKAMQSLEQSVNEIEKFKNSVRIMEDNLEKGKFYLFRDLDCLNTTQSNRLLISNLKGRIEKMIYEKHLDLENVVKNLYSMMNKHESSFLTEEEEAIKKISEKIKVLKAKIDAKDALPVFSKRYKKNRHYSGSSEDPDTKELKHLNEQIKILKSKMLAKGDQLNQMKVTSSEIFNPSQASSANTIYLPLNHLRNSDQLSTYRMEPLELYDECTSEYIASDNFQNDLVLIRDEQKMYEKKLICPMGSVYDDTRDSKSRSNHVYYVSKGDNVVPNDKKYTSSIEIPADQLENFKRGLKVKRSRSETSSRKTSTSSSEESECYTARDKRAKSVVQFKNPLEQNGLSVSLKSMKRPGPEKQTMTDPGNNSGSEKYQKEIDDLKRVLNQKNEIINRHQDQQRQLDELKANELAMYDKKNEVLTRKLQDQNEELQILKEQLNELTNKEKIERRMSVTGQDVKTDNENSIQEPLICNIPEHHKLEDLNHELKTQISKLRAYLRETRSNRINDVDLCEKKAEFEALDLAINERKQQLLKLEMTKNLQLNQQFYLDKDQLMIQEEIFCLEDTLKKRSQELHNVERLIKNAKKEIMCLKNSKLKSEKECEINKKKNVKIKKEMDVLNKKADDAAIELIAVQEELNFLREEKNEMETCIDKMKSEMVNFLQEIRVKDLNQKSQLVLSNNYSLNELKQNVLEQKKLLESLNQEIDSKKKEMDTLKEKSSKYTELFKCEIEQSQREIRDLKTNKESLLNQVTQLKSKFEQYQTETRNKSHQVEEKSVQLKENEKELEKIVQLKDEEGKKLAEIEKYLKERRVECDEMESHLDKLRQNEDEFAKHLEELRSNIEIEKSNFDELKNTNEELNSIKHDMKGKITSLGEILEKLEQEYEIRENDIKNMNSMTKEKQLAFKRIEDELADFEYEKESLSQDVNKLNEKIKKKKSELEKLEDNIKSLEQKFIHYQAESNNLTQKNTATRQELDSLNETIKEFEIKLKDLSVKSQTKQSMIDQLNEKCLEKKEELETLEAYLDEIKTEYQNEKRQFTALQSECSKQKKIHDELKFKNKNMNKTLEENEINAQHIEELEDELEERGKKIKELEDKLDKKNHEFENLSQDFLNHQEETRLFKLKLRNLEDLLKEQNENVNIQERLNLNSSQTVKNQQPISSLLITPTIRKSLGQSYIESFDSPRIPSEISNSTLYTDEHSRAKETLAKSFQDKLINLERSKIQTKNILESLKLNLNDIELLTANNIYKITSITS